MRPADGEGLDTFTIVITEANATMRPLRDRMPAILAPEDYRAWLAGATPAERVHGLWCGRVRRRRWWSIVSAP